MKREITVCHSILSYIFENLNPFDKENFADLLLKEIQRNKLLLNDDLEQHYETKFQSNPASWQAYLAWIISQKQYPDLVKRVQNGSLNPNINALTQDTYEQCLLSICENSVDKIVFSDLLQSLAPALRNFDVFLMEQTTILDRTAQNAYNDYRFPIIRKRISQGQSSSDLGQWLSKIIQTETDITIIDNYIYQNQRSFRTHFLAYLPQNANIKIYTLLDRITQQQLIREFSRTFYSQWNIEVWLIPDKGEQHDRNIFTNRYHIAIGKGFGVFGNRGQTAQSDISVDFIDNIADRTLPNARKIL